MADKSYKRIKRCSLLAYHASNPEGKNAKTKLLYYTSSSLMVLKECFDSTATIAAVLLFIITVASFAEPAESCSLGHENGTLIACEEGTEKEPEAKPEETFPWKDIRLPSFIVPVHYDLFMDLNLETFENSGQVNITFQVTNATNFIVLHSKDLNLSRILVLQDNETIIPVLQHLEYPKHQQLYIKIDGTFIPDLKYKLRIDFRRHLEESMEGFYVSSYTTSDGEKRYLATTQFQPTAARSAFPCFDEPAMKATFQLKMVHDVNYRAYFNSEILQIAPYSEGRSISSFQKTVKMSTYLVAFIVCDFREREITNLDGVDIRVLVPSEQCEESEYALEIAADILDFYQTFFNISYPLSKLDMAAIPDFAYGAMENWGLVSFRLVAILYSPSETSANNQGIVASVISHELAHQWFGNLVTMQWWNDLWLNEGFACFMQYIALDSIRSEWDMMDEFVVSFTQEALSLDSLQNSHPIVIDAIDPQEIEAAFDLIVYKKGASIINMLANVLSMETVQKGLSSYLKKYSFQNARTEDVWNEFTEVDLSHMNVSQIMDTWTRQKGYPLVTVTLEHTTVKVKQERFLLFPDSGNISSPNSDNTSSSDISPYDYKWFVPITYVTDLGNKHSTYWLNMTDGEFALPSEAEWLKINVNQAGFYRVMYDNVLWEKLTNVLRSNHKILTPADRSNLLDDALILSKAGILEAVLAFNVTRYLEKEENYAPWKTAISHFKKLAVLMQDNEVLLSLFQKYVVKLLKPTISALGWKDKGNNVQKKLRSDILTAAVLHGDEQTVCTAMQIFQDWMHNGVKVPPNLRNAVYNAGVQYGGRKEWEFCWQQYQQTQVPSEKWLLLAALGKTRDRSLLSLYLNYSLDKDKIKPQDTYLAVSYAAVNLIGRSSTWAFIRSNWVLLLENFSFALPTIITEGISYFSTQADYDEVKAFFSEVTVGAGENALKQSLETIKANIQWRENTEASVTKWLQENI